MRMSNARAASQWAAALAAVFMAAFAAPPTLAAPAAKPLAKPAVKAPDDKPLLVASFGDWGVYTSKSGKGKICYTLAQPKTREPAGLNRDPAYAFISNRPGEGVKNEPSFIMGFDLIVLDPKKPPAPKDAAAAKAANAAIGDKRFELFPKGANLWVKNPAQEPALIDEMRKGSKLTVKGASLKGNVTTDNYLLAGFSQALDRVQKECAGG